MPSPVAHLSDLTHPGALYAFPFCCSRFSPHFSPQFLRPSLPTELRTMSVTLESISLSSPNPNPSPTTGSPLRITPYHPSSQSSSSLRFASLLGPRPRPHGVSAVARTLSPIGLGHGLVPLTRRTSCNRLVLASAASREDSSKIEVEKENNNVGAGAEASEEEWQKTLASLKEQALKMQSVSQEVYEIYSERAKVILIETSKQLKAQADKASQDLNELAKVIGEDGKEYLSLAAENSPVPLKDVVETFTSPSDDLDKISKVRDFYLGIPYGVALSVGGLLSFMLTGSIPAVRFGVILGGALLALSISSLRAWKKGESLALALKGQTAIAGIIFLREICLLSQKPSFSTRLATIISGAMVAFYLYRIMLDGDVIKGSNGEDGKEN